MDRSSVWVSEVGFQLKLLGPSWDFRDLSCLPAQKLCGVLLIHAQRAELQRCIILPSARMIMYLAIVPTFLPTVITMVAGCYDILRVYNEQSRRQVLSEILRNFDSSGGRLHRESFRCFRRLIQISATGSLGSLHCAVVSVVISSPDHDSQSST